MPDDKTMVTGTQQFSTRTLLYCAVFAGLQTLLYLALSPMTALLASIFPPGYAVAAGAYSCGMFAARLFIGRNGTATLTAAITGVLIATVSPIGLVALIPMVIAGATFDVVLLWGRRRPPRRVMWTPVPAALCSGIALFLVSLPAFSTDHLTLGVLTATLLGRAAGQVGAALLSTVIIAALSRAGVRAVQPLRGAPEGGTRAP